MEITHPKHPMQTNTDKLTIARAHYLYWDRRAATLSDPAAAAQAAAVAANWKMEMISLELIQHPTSNIHDHPPTYYAS